MNLVLQGQHATGLGRVAVTPKRASIKMQAAANFSQSSSLLPRVPADDNNAPAFCNWPRSCPWPKEQEIQVPRSGGLGVSVALLNKCSKALPFQLNSKMCFLFFQELFSGEDTMLPPDVEQMALFSDSFSDSNHDGSEGYNWWFSKLWRYQGL
jgi:hypothetical protein